VTRFKAAAVAGGCLAFAYPFAVYFGLGAFEPRHLAFVLVLAALGRVAAARRYFGRADVAIVAVTAILAGAIAWSNSELMLRFYPVVISGGLLAAFAQTLLRPPSMIERFARLSEPDLGAAGVAYTRRVTQAWCVFFAANGAIALYTAVAASRETWLLYNGFISYLLVGAMYGGEWLIRRRVLNRVELAESRG
jgi:uncharacterized membrane protein